MATIEDAELNFHHNKDNESEITEYCNKIRLQKNPEKKKR